MIHISYCYSLPHLLSIVTAMLLLSRIATAQPYTAVQLDSQSAPDSVYWCGFTPSADTVIVCSGDRSRDFGLWVIDKWMDYIVPDSSNVRPTMFAFSRDGGWAVNTGPKSAVWKTSTWQEHTHLKAWSMLEEVVFTPDGSKVIGVNAVGAYVWDVQTGDVIDTIGTLALMPRRGLQISPDGKHLYFANDSGRIWKISYPEKEIIWEKKRQSARRLHLSPDGTRLLSFGLNDQRVRVEIFEMDAMTGEVIATYPPGEWSLFGVVYNRDGSLIITATDSTARVWDTRTQENVASIKTQGKVLWANFSPIDNRVVIGQYSGTTLWELRSTSNIDAPVTGVDRQAQLAIYPNPARSELTISFFLQQKSRARIVLVDALGRQVRIVAEDDFHRGETMLRANVEDLAAGVYRCLLQSQGQTVALPVQIMQ